MRKEILYMMAVTAVAAGCSTSELEESDIHLREEYITAITVSAGNPGEAGATRTALMDDGKNYQWSSDDKLYIVDKAKITAGSTSAPSSSQVATFTLNAADAGKTTGSFVHDTGTAELTGSEDGYVVLYSSDKHEYTYSGAGTERLSGAANYLPYYIPITQQYVANGIETSTMPMYAYTTDLSDIRLTCLGSIIRLNLYDTTVGDDGATPSPVTVDKIVLSIPSTNSTFALAGYCAIKKDDSARDADSDPDYMNADVECFGPWSSSNGGGKSSVTLSCGSGVTVSADGSHPTAFNIVIGAQHGNTATGGYANSSDGIAHYNGEEVSNRLRVSIYHDGNLTNPIVYELTALDHLAQNKVYKFSAKDLKGTWTPESEGESYSIACWGDSFTHSNSGYTYTTTLASYLGSSWTLYDGGVGGDTSIDVMVRQGCLKSRFVNAYTLNYGTTVESSTLGSLTVEENELTSGLTARFTGPSRWWSTRPERLFNPCTINGVQCTVTNESVTPLESCTDVAVAAQTGITSYGATITKNVDVNVYYIGRNVSFNSVDHLIRQQKAMVDFGSSKYIVLGFHEKDFSNFNSDYSSAYTQGIDYYRTTMKSTFGDHFLSLNEEIRARAEELLVATGVYASAEAFEEDESDTATKDKEYLADGNMPYSFYKTDLYHPNELGCKVFAMLIHDKMVKLGYLDDDYILSTGSDL